MFRFLVAAILLWGVQAFCSIEDFDLEEPKKFLELIDEQPSLGYIVCGHMHLLLKDFELALKDFHRAEVYLYRYPYPYGPRYSELELLIQFGYAVTYDNLGLRNKCIEAIGYISLLASRYEKDQECDEEGEEDNSDSTSQSTYNEGIFLLRKIARLAPSGDVRRSLFDLIGPFEEVEEDEDDEDTETEEDIT